MRRIVDSVIFLLVVYSICWPVVRGMSDRPSPRSATDERRFAVDVIGTDVVPAATMRFARTAIEAGSGAWIGECTQQSGVAGSAVASSVAREAGWVAISVNGVEVDARPVPPCTGDATTEFVVPRDRRIVTGRVALDEFRARGSGVRVGIVSATGERTLDVACDADGRFLIVIPSDTQPGDAIRICTGSGEELAKLSLRAAADPLIDLGVLGD